MPPLFVYGLLRPGERFWPDLAPAVRRRTPARVRGRLAQHVSGRYPLLELADDGWVLGDLLDLEQGPAVHACVAMELSSGYEARWLPVYPRDADEPLTTAVVFCWPWGSEQRGASIPSGDWQRR